MGTRSPAAPRSTARLVAFGSLLWAAGCGCPPAAVQGPDGSCTYTSCDRECRDAGLCYGSCAAARCNCTDVCAGDAEPDRAADCEVTDRAGDDCPESRDTAGDDATEIRDDADGGPDCLFRSTRETRAGATAGVTCTLVSVPELEDTLLSYSGDGDRIVLAGYDESLAWRPVALWEYRRSTGCFRILDNGADTRGVRVMVDDPAVEGPRVAYAARWHASPTAPWHCEIRLLDIETREKRVLDWNESAGRAGRPGCTMDSVRLRYPWVIWRDVRESTYYAWHVLAANVETGEVRDLSVDPPDGSRWWSAITVDLCGSTASWGSVGYDMREKVVAADLDAGERWVVTEADGMRWSAAVTPRWFAWLDQRNHPRCSYMSPCGTDIYGVDRATGVEQALVIAGDSMQGSQLDGDGPWLAYEDQRGGTDVTEDYDREEDIFALHLPTMTEIRVTDWPGYEAMTHVYRRTGGSWAVLLVYEIGYFESLYRLWDCDLPEPEAGP